jgi:hypothetical protein
MSLRRTCEHLASFDYSLASLRMCHILHR